jgi:hypothetical protein
MNNFRIAHMYPDLLNLYGDRGNLLCLKKRIEWYGHRCEIVRVNLNENIDFKNIDLFFMGGGSDREQSLVYNDLLKKADILHREIDAGLPCLCICGAYQLLGRYYRSYDGTTMQGLGFFNLYTAGQKGRLIGNILIENRAGTVVGFENHGGRTYLEDPNLEPFGRVVKGFGNNGEDKSEGIWYKNLIGTYLHGPLLPKNPGIADYFIKTMARRQGLELANGLNDNIENTAHEQVKRMILRLRR